VKKYSILVIDSGTGGKLVYNRLINDFPNENFIFFEDVINAPYGNKSKKRLLEITKSNIEMFSQKNIKVVIFACNTLSSVVLEDIQKIFPNKIFLGINPDYYFSAYKDLNILVLSTKKTKQYILNKQYGKNVKVVGFKFLAKRIDSEYQDLRKVKNYLKSVLKRTKFVPDIIVLGCTHYILFKEYIASLFDRNVVVLDNYLPLKVKLNKITKQFYSEV